MPLRCPGSFALALWVVSAAAVAQEGKVMAQHPFLTSTHTFGVGAAIQEIDGDVRATRPGLPPVAVDLDSLGIDDTYDSWKFGYRWRFADRWQLSAGAFTFDTDGTTTAERTFNFDGREFAIGATLDTSFRADTFIVDVMYSVYRDRNAEIALGGGIHAFNLETEIKGEATIGGNPTPTASSASADLLVPLPNLRANAFYAVNEKLGLGVTAGWLSASYDDQDGQFVYLKAEASYFFDDRWGLNLGYQFTDIELTYQKSGTEQDDWNLEFDGPTVSLMYAF